MHYTGLVERSAAFMQAAESDQATDWGDQYMRFAFTFDTGAERFLWLNKSLFAAAVVSSGPPSSSTRSIA